VFEKIGDLREYRPLDVLSLVPKNLIFEVGALVAMQGRQNVRDQSS